MIEIQKNNREVIRMSKNEFKGKFYADIRVYYKDKTTGDYLPSGKGVAVAVEKFPEFFAALCDFAEQEKLNEVTTVNK